MEKSGELFSEEAAMLSFKGACTAFLALTPYALDEDKKKAWITFMTSFTNILYNVREIGDEVRMLVYEMNKRYPQIVFSA